MEVRIPYTPLNEKAREFHRSPASLKGLIGGMGSGKTWMACAEIIMLCFEYPGTLAVVCRKTFGELDRSTRIELESLLPKPLVARRYNHNDHTIHLINGSRILFFSLDDPHKIRSINANWIFLDEASEISEEMAVMLQARLGRDARVPRKCFIIASNPTNTDHWLYKWFGKGPGPDRGVWHFSTYENAHNLSPDYIKDLERSLPPDLFRRYVLGEWGHVNWGDRVYGDFSQEVHVRELSWDPDYPVIRGWDFGYHRPACVWLQVVKGTWVRVLREKLGRNQTIEAFGREVVSESQHYFPGAEFEDWGDPSGEGLSRGGETDDTPVRILSNKFGIRVLTRRAPQSRGINLIRSLHTQIKDGVPVFLIDPDCKILIEGFSGGYTLRKTPDGTVLRDEPKKDGYYEHLQDALRYALIGVFGDAAGVGERRVVELPRYRPAFAGTSW